jgi:hypothetical protein
MLSVRSLRSRLVASAFNEPRSRPPRRIQPLEILSMAYPPGSTIVIEGEDELLPYTNSRPLPITVSIIRNSPMGLSFPSSSSFDHRAPLSPRGAVTVTRSFPAVPSVPQPSLRKQDKAIYVPPPPTLVGSDSRPSTPATEVEVDNGPFGSQIYYHKSTCVASQSRTGGQSPERVGNYWNASQASSSQQSGSGSQSDVSDFVMSY